MAAPAYRASMRRTLASVHTFFMIPVHESPDRVEQYVATVDAAVAAGVERIVYSSFVGVAPDHAPMILSAIVRHYPESY